jgi:hypothetical protein
MIVTASLLDLLLVEVKQFIGKVALSRVHENHSDETITKTALKNKKGERSKVDGQMRLRIRSDLYVVEGQVKEVE